jgi:hypothetical protein
MSSKPLPALNLPLTVRWFSSNYRIRHLFARSYRGVATAISREKDVRLGTGYESIWRIYSARSTIVWTLEESHPTAFDLLPRFMIEARKWSRHVCGSAKCYLTPFFSLSVRVLPWCCKNPSQAADHWFNVSVEVSCHSWTRRRDLHCESVTWRK